MVVDACPAASDLFRRFCKPSEPADASDVQQLSRLLEVTKEALHGHLVELVREARDRPFLISYASDGAPSSSVARKSFSLPGCQGVRRAGRGTHEYLVQTVRRL